LPLFQKTLEKYALDGRWAPDWQLWGWGEGTIARDREVQRPPAGDFRDIELCQEGKVGLSGGVEPTLLPLLRVVEDLTREVELYDKLVAQAGRPSRKFPPPDGVCHFCIQPNPAY
jgi:hypothetical protein